MHSEVDGHEGQPQLMLKVCFRQSGMVMIRQGVL